ncbi:TonB-dependent siderophore receptor [Neisseria sp. oral taxon 020 str. F0370]|nr:TonB-dependent siderophore receptor [Neisseria sp. oral taxon 020 str. F0370]
MLNKYNRYRFSTLTTIKDILMKYPKSRPTLLALALMPLFAFAEDEAVLDTVTVTGTKSASLNQGYSTAGTYAPLGIGMTLRETPQSVSVMTAKQMEDWKLDSLRKVMEQTNGVTVKSGSGGSDRYTGLHARGMEVRNFQIDGVPMRSSGFSKDSWTGWGGIDTRSLDRVEVLRGASALLGGTGDPSAQVSLVRKRPTKERQGEIGIEAGSHSRAGISGDLSGRLNDSGSLRGRIVTGYERSGYQTEDAKMRNSSLYAVAEWDAAPDTTLSVGTQLQHRRETDTPIFLPTAYDSEGYPLKDEISRRANNSTADTSYKYSSRNVFAELRHRFSPDWKGKLEYNWMRNTIHDRQGYAAMKTDHDSREIDLIETRDDEKTTSHSFVASVDGKYSLLGRKHDIMAGISGFHTKTRDPASFARYDNAFGLHDFLNNRSLRPANPVPDAEYTVDDDIRARQIGGYFATRFRPVERLALIGGARYSRITMQKAEHVAGTSEKVSRSKATPYIGAVFDLNENLSAYTSYGTSFEPVFERGQDGRFLKPTTGRNVEIGLKGEFSDQRLNASAAFFDTRKNGMAKYVESGDYYVSEDNIRTRGFEAEISGRIRDNWSANAGYTLQNRKGGEDSYEADLPRHQIKLATTYDLNERLTLGGSLRWQSKTSNINKSALNDETDPAALERARRSATQKAYTLVDLMAAYRIGKNAEATLNVNNVFNTRYRTLSTFLAYGEARSAVLGFKYRF